MRDTSSNSTLETDTRGITWTIEAFLSVLLLMSILMWAMPTDTSSGLTQDQLHQTQLQQDGADVLSGTDDTGALKDGILYWNPDPATDPDPSNPPDGAQWHEDDPANDDDASLTASGEYLQFADAPNHPLAPAFQMLQDDSISYNFEIRYQGTGNQDTRSRTVVYQGAPGSDAVVVEHSFVLYDDDPLISQNGDPMTGSDISCGGFQDDEVVTVGKSNQGDCEFFIKDAYDADSPNLDYDYPRYNVIRVRLTLWT